MTRALLLVAVAATTAASSEVLADDAEPDAEPVAVPAFQAGRVTLRSAAVVGAERDGLALDVWAEVNPRLRLGLTSSDEARRLLGAGRGLCLGTCDPQVAGVAAEAQVRFGPFLVGRAALDAARFAPTVAALELGLDLVQLDGPWSSRLSPVVRLGIARRDLENRDTAAVLGQLARRAWSSGGFAVYVRGGIDLDELGATPSLGAAAGVWIQLGPVGVTVRSGAAELLHGRGGDTLFGELALAWST